MERLGIESLNAFRQLERKHPEVFVNVNPHYYARVKYPWYDKDALDKFAEMLNQEKR
jgi:hypothetical protein